MASLLYMGSSAPGKRASSLRLKVLELGSAPGGLKDTSVRANPPLVDGQARARLADTARLHLQPV